MKFRLMMLAVVAGALSLGACGSSDSDAADTTATNAQVGTEQDAAADTTSIPSDDGAGEPEMAQEIEPPGEVSGGTVGRSYLADNYPPELSGIIDLMVADLASTLGADPGAVVVVLVEEVTWSDASLGCPQPGMSYAQVVTDGMRVIFEADGLLYDYRSGGTGDPFLCAKGAPGEKGSPGVYQIGEDGSVIVVVPPSFGEGGLPSDGINPPDQ